jgi:acetylornithine deacetylase/succinyl-diaminopimelate desuccinylase-like protein
MRHLLLSVLALVACRPPAVSTGGSIPDPDPGDPVALLQAYLRIDTTNPPGRELTTARFLHRLLEREGIESRVIELGGGRANLLAILRGDGSRRPVVLLHHMDVVPADAKHWRLAPPFSGRIVGGEVVGRGAVDIKGKGAIELATLVALKRKGARLHRDLILLAVADEENNSLGARAMVERHAGLLRGAEYLIDEGMSVRVDRDRRTRAYLVSVGEKAPLWLTLRFTGRPGHGSVPHPGSAVERAVRAASRILAWRRPVRLLPGLRAWIKLEASRHDLGDRIPRGGLDAALDQPELLEALADRVPEIGAALRDTIALTGLQGSEKVNVIPNEASLRLDCRLLPGSDRERFLADLRAAIDDPTAEIKIDEHYTTSSSPASGPFLEALAAVASRLDPGAPVVPTILRCSTDASTFRKLGIHAYGFEPYRLTEEETALAHGNDERLSVQNLRDGVVILRELLLELDRR